MADERGPGVLTEFWGYQQQDFCGDLQKFSQKINQ